MRSVLLAAALTTFACKQDVKVYVECASTGIAYACTVTHQQGSDAAEACWDVAVTCQNGTRAVGHGCQEVQPESKASKFIPVSSFTKAEQCDMAAGVAVENIKVSLR